MERARLMDRTRNCTQKRDTIASLCLENSNGNKTAALTKKILPTIHITEILPTIQSFGKL